MSAISECKSAESMKKIVIKDVEGNSKFGLGSYGKIQLVIRKKDGYCNASKLVTQVGKLYASWFTLRGTKNKIAYLCKIFNTTEDKIIQYVGDEDVRDVTWGTYVHPKLIPVIAAWASIEFEFAVSDIVNEFYAREAKELLREKDSTIDRLSETIARMEKAIKTNASKQDVNMHRLEEKVDTANDRLRRVLPNHVPRTEANNKIETFILLSNPEEDKDGNEYDFQYYVMRRQEKDVKSAVKSYIKKNPGAKVVLRVKLQPNARNLYSRIREQLSDDLLFSNNQFSISEDSDLDEKDLIDAIRDIDNDKYQVPAHRGYNVVAGGECEI